MADLYQSRPHYVRAQQLQPGSKPDRLAFGRVHPDATGGIYYLETPAYPRPKRQQVHMGEWVVEHPDGSVQIMYPEEFEAMYSPVEEVDDHYEEFLVSDASGSGG